MIPLLIRLTIVVVAAAADVVDLEWVVVDCHFARKPQMPPLLLLIILLTLVEDSVVWIQQCNVKTLHRYRF